MKSAPTTVVQLIDTLTLGGSERQIVEQLRVIDRRRWRPLVASLHADGELVPMLADLEVPHAAFPLHTGLEHPNTARQVARLAWWLRKERVSVVHAQDFYSNVIGVAACKLARVPVLASRLDLANWLTWPQLTALGWACRAADRVIVNARVLGERVAREQRVDPGRIHVVYNGLNIRHFDNETRRVPSPPLPARPSGLMRLVVVANMHLPTKGQGDLLDALALLRQGGARVQLLLIGDGAYRPHLEAQARSLALDEVHFLGRRQDVPAVLVRSDIACLPSWAEGLPNAVMEGMAARLPVVATAVGGCPELVEDGVSGLLVPPHDPPALARAIGRILDDPDAARVMGERARARVQGLFAMESTVAEFTRIYRDLIQPSASASA